MTNHKHTGIDGLLALNGCRYFVDDDGDLEVIFKTRRIAQSSGRPHGLKYSLVLINANGDRLVCFDNAHAIGEGTGPGKKNSKHFDHKHIGNRVTPYTFIDANKLVADFWVEVDKLVQ